MAVLTCLLHFSNLSTQNYIDYIYIYIIQLYTCCTPWGDVVMLSAVQHSQLRTTNTGKVIHNLQFCSPHTIKSSLWCYSCDTTALIFHLHMGSLATRLAPCSIKQLIIIPETKLYLILGVPVVCIQLSHQQYPSGNHNTSCFLRTQFPKCCLHRPLPFLHTQYFHQPILLRHHRNCSEVYWYLEYKMS